jgi:hypothetical protein
MKTFPLKIDENLHKLIKHAAIEEDSSVHSWIIDAINDKLYQHNNIIKDKKVNYGNSIKSANDTTNQK